MPIFNQNLAALRQHTVKNRKEMAESLGVARTSYINYEEGNTDPKIEFLIALRKIYEVDLNIFLTELYDVTKLKYKLPTTAYERKKIEQKKDRPIEHLMAEISAMKERMKSIEKIGGEISREKKPI